ncbi:hypothetical protein EGR_00142 [Echinococcus granulosus]|uniref:Uncharacterized protein n=1 Tax=Echinococcus granulosus TaxID=6210 RepID=W6UU73_ECHGR|nr:hypothetical protein EGR_00142 [Echinococcus granulosus]EUB64873.1 hypothetical protein EGR_00142 [Echinococcus granulosus]
MPNNTYLLLVDQILLALYIKRWCKYDRYCNENLKSMKSRIIPKEIKPNSNNLKSSKSLCILAGCSPLQSCFQFEVKGVGIFCVNKIFGCDWDGNSAIGSMMSGNVMVEFLRFQNQLKIGSLYLPRFALNHFLPRSPINVFHGIKVLENFNLILSISLCLVGF